MKKILLILGIVVIGFSSVGCGEKDSLSDINMEHHIESRNKLRYPEPKGVEPLDTEVLDKESTKDQGRTKHQVVYWGNGDQEDNERVSPQDSVESQREEEIKKVENDEEVEGESDQEKNNDTGFGEW